MQSDVKQKTGIGFSLLEVMVALAVGSVGLYFIANLITNSMRGASKVSAKLDFDNTGILISKLLSSPTSCQAYFANLTFLSAPGGLSSEVIGASGTPLAIYMPGDITNIIVKQGATINKKLSVDTLVIRDIALLATDSYIANVYLKALDSSTSNAAPYSRNFPISLTTQDVPSSSPAQKKITQCTGQAGVNSANSATAIGAIQCFAGSSLPGGYIAANGSDVSRSTYSDLFSTIGTSYGNGDGSTTFGLPQADVPSFGGIPYRYYRLVITSIGGNYGAATIRRLQFKWDGKWQPNAMTANNSGQIGGLSATVSASSIWSSTYEPFRAFDNGNAASTGPAWFSSSGSYSTTAPYSGTEWLKVDLGIKKRVSAYQAECRWDPYNHSCPDAFHLEASNDNATWTTISGSTISGSMQLGMIVDGLHSNGICGIKF